MSFGFLFKVAIKVLVSLISGDRLFQMLEPAMQRALRPNCTSSFHDSSSCCRRPETPYCRVTVMKCDDVYQIRRSGRTGQQ